VVLSNIGTVKAHEALRLQIEKEPDPELKAFIQRKLN
jgi:hypothetical protein